MSGATRLRVLVTLGDPPIRPWHDLVVDAIRRETPDVIVQQGRSPAACDPHLVVDLTGAPVVGGRPSGDRYGGEGLGALDLAGDGGDFRARAMSGRGGVHHVDLNRGDDTTATADIPPLGVWRYGFGDGAPFADGAAGTIARLYRILDDPSRAVVLHEGWFKGPSRDSAGTQSVGDRVAPWCARVLRQLNAGDLDVLTGPAQSVVGCVEREPPQRSRGLASLADAVRRWRRREHWTIGIVHLPLAETLARGVVPEPRWVSGVPRGCFLADPFPLSGAVVDVTRARASSAQSGRGAEAQSVSLQNHPAEDSSSRTGEARDQGVIRLRTEAPHYGVIRLLAEQYCRRLGRGSIVSLDVTPQGEIVGSADLLTPPHHAAYPFVLHTTDGTYCVPDVAATGAARAYRLPSTTARNAGAAPDAAARAAIGTARAYRLDGDIASVMPRGVVTDTQNAGAAPGDAADRAAQRAHRIDGEGSSFDTLLDCFPAVDPTIVYHEGRWWLFCTHREQENQTELHVFYADHWRGPWQPHLLNPVKSDARSSRPAGTPFAIDGSLYRPAQDCSRRYGGGIAINRIAELTPTRFREERVLSLGPDPSWPWPDGLHTLNAIDDLIIIDALRVRPGS